VEHAADGVHVRSRVAGGVGTGQFRSHEGRLGAEALEVLVALERDSGRIEMRIADERVLQHTRGVRIGRPVAAWQSHRVERQAPMHLAGRVQRRDAPRDPQAERTGDPRRHRAGSGEHPAERLARDLLADDESGRVGLLDRPRTGEDRIGRGDGRGGAAGDSGPDGGVVAAS
jgi:hypothetical protein